MTDDEIEEKLRSLSPAQLSALLGKLSRNDALTNKQRPKLLGLQSPLQEEAKQWEEAAKHVLREKGPQMLEFVQESLNRNSLTSEVRRELERTASILAGYQVSFWLPTALWRKVLMFLFVAIGVVGAFGWSAWFGLFVFLGCSLSPRIVGEVAFLIGKFSK